MFGIHIYYRVSVRFECICVSVLPFLYSYTFHLSVCWFNFYEMNAVHALRYVVFDSCKCIWCFHFSTSITILLRFFVCLFYFIFVRFLIETTYRMYLFIICKIKIFFFYSYTQIGLPTRMNIVCDRVWIELSTFVREPTEYAGECVFFLSKHVLVNFFFSSF